MTTPRTITADEIGLRMKIRIECGMNCRQPAEGYVCKLSPGCVEFTDGDAWIWSRVCDCDTVTLIEDAPTELPATMMEPVNLDVDSHDELTPLPRPEHVVKAEALREMAAHWERKGSSSQSLAYWELMGRADELDPPVPARPAEPKGLGAVVRDKSNDQWVRVDSVDQPWRFGHDCFTWEDLVAEYGPVTVLSEGWTGDQT